MSLTPNITPSIGRSVRGTMADLWAFADDGVWYDPSDLSTLWQDDAKIVPVTSSGDVVAVMEDKSGNGHDAVQTNAAKRWQYFVDGNGKGCLAADGVGWYTIPSLTGLAGTEEWIFSVGLVRDDTDPDEFPLSIGKAGIGAGSYPGLGFRIRGGGANPADRLQVSAANATTNNSGLLLVQDFPYPDKGVISATKVYARENRAQANWYPSPTVIQDFDTYNAAFNTLGGQNLFGTPASLLKSDFYGLVMAFSASAIPPEYIVYSESYIAARMGIAI